MKKVLVVLVVLVGLLSCSSPLDKRYDSETYVLDLKKIKESGKVSDDDLMILFDEVMGYKLLEIKSGSGGVALNSVLNNMTYAEILNVAKDIKNAQEELAEEAKKEVIEKNFRLGSIITVALYDKGYDEGKYEKYITYGLAFENNTDKDIRAFKGSISIQDLFGVEIKSIGLTIDDGISSNKILRETYTTKYNQFLDEDVRLKSKKLKDLKIVWIPEKFIFTDGTTIE